MNFDQPISNQNSSYVPDYSHGTRQMIEGTQTGRVYSSHCREEDTRHRAHCGRYPAVASFEEAYKREPR